MRVKKLAAVFMAGVITVTSVPNVMAADFSDGKNTLNFAGGGYNPEL